MSALTPELGLLALCVFVGFSTQAMSGFGAIIISLTLGAQLLPIPELLPVLVSLVVLQTAALTFQHYRHVDWPLLFRIIVPPMLTGFVVGLVVAPRVPADGLKLVFGVGVSLFALRELWRLRSAAEPAPMPKPLEVTALLGSGVAQGVFASGGPLLVYVLGRQGHDKGTFRATLVVLWLTLDAVLVTSFALGGRLGEVELTRAAWLLPVLIVANLFGSWAHDKVDERSFRGVVFGILLLAGLALLVPRPA